MHDRVEGAFGADIDYAMLVKLLRPGVRERASLQPGEVHHPVMGRPDPAHVSTSFVERHNWDRPHEHAPITRLSNGFSRKIENHEAAVALNYFVYNFIKIHCTLKVTPAMAAGVTSKLWEVSDLVALLEAVEGKKAA